MEKSLVVYLPDGFADWEGAFLMAELRQAGRKFQIASDMNKHVRSIGGLHVIPEIAIQDFEADDLDGLVLIGSDGWSDPKQNQKALALAKDLLLKNKFVFAICGATSALAGLGVLDQRPHTSNNLDFLKNYVKNYGGEKYYSDKPAITDKNLVTAAGSSPIEFTFEVMKALNLYNAKYREQWFDLFKNGVVPPNDFWEQQQPT